jgi:copper chaperone
MAEFNLRIENMHCGSCVRRVSQALASTGAMEVKEVRVGAARLSSLRDPAPVELAVAALAKAGYPAHLEQ